ncbi:hypothetical protein AKJ65_03020 [candidate division MSBL1 archaeon SCGC-AAA259E19]|uniref:Glycogen debranching protein n=1 Tax=candidate division MSBL1 archaeon SCGC-AAA259E19 TaxID=1698264 RepID=A0A133UL61_9EURY|nr:hypothetical protein AKJ65_03020 [candidate division MSBL1 archaeon SCGC-AAA259E19]
MSSFGSDTCQDLEKAESKEWILTNGLGGYSSSTIPGVNTRKYHGLLISPMDPPWKRRMFLSKVEETANIDGQNYELSTNYYPGLVHPKGYRHLEKYLLNPLPSFRYQLPGFLLLKKVFMPWHRNAVILNYRVFKKPEISANISVRPLVNSRELDEITKVDQDTIEIRQKKKNRKITVSFPETNSRIYLGSDNMHYTESELSETERWYRNMEYPKEKERGYEYQEDHYNPGYFHHTMDDPEGEFSEFNLLTAAGHGAEKDFDDIYSKDPESFKKEEKKVLQRLGQLKTNLPPSLLEHGKDLSPLVYAADSFVTVNDEIIAGYHWFSTWGRDSLIALPGLTLVTGRAGTARKILHRIANHERGGLIPNRFGREWGEMNSIDSSLLYFYAIHKYLAYTDDLEFAENIWKVLSKILNTFLEGVEGKVKTDDDGLLETGEGLTWMDARVDEKCVTPRAGKTGEINALWYNALRILETVGRLIGKKIDSSLSAERMKKSFNEKFWNPNNHYLYDVVGKNKDDRLRPNQIFAIGLPFTILDEKRAESVISVIEDRLLTPYGLRTLDEENSEYRGSYKGAVGERDRAYHQGTVWPWLMGPFVTSLVKVRGRIGKKRSENLLLPLLGEHLKEAGLGTISEVFDGEEPHNPRGCISQAWSVGEILRCYVEDVKGIKPPFEEKYME